MESVINKFAPTVIRPNGFQITKLKNFFVEGKGKTLIITGAGLSTDSGIPDYRSPNGSYSRGHKPVTHQEFIANEYTRKRYWARSVFGIKHFQKAQPNKGHFSIASLEQNKLINGLITQNVDRLHHKAGSNNVVELHGHNDGVKCLNCSSEFSRNNFTVEIANQNSEFVKKVNEIQPNVEQRADGDADVNQKDIDFNDFQVAGCYNCGGVLMPTVVFFGGSVPIDIKEESFRLVDDCSQLLVLGSSVQTFSAFRLLKQAKEQNKEIGIITLGETRGDSICTWKVGCSISEILMKTSEALV